MAAGFISLDRGTTGALNRGYFARALLCESCKALLYKRVAIGSAVAAVALLAAGAFAATRHHAVPAPTVARVSPTVAAAQNGVAVMVKPAKQAKAVVAPKAPKRQPHPQIQLRATISLYEHTTSPSVLWHQGCAAAKRGVGGVVILDFGAPAWNGHTYGTWLFSNRFAANWSITRGLLGYARGFVGCLPGGSNRTINLARGTSNYHPHLPSPYRAGLRWAAATVALQRLLRADGLDRHVISAAADDVEPAWDRSFHRTRDFYRGYAASRVGHLLYNYGSLDGGVEHGVWTAHQAFFVASGMRYSVAIPEIYNRTMARQWAALAYFARHRYHRPVKFAGVMTTHTSANHGMLPVVAHHTLRRYLAASVGRGPDSYVPPAATNIISAS